MTPADDRTPAHLAARARAAEQLASAGERLERVRAAKEVLTEAERRMFAAMADHERALCALQRLADARRIVIAAIGGDEADALLEEGVALLRAQHAAAGVVVEALTASAAAMGASASPTATMGDIRADARALAALDQARARERDAEQAVADFDERIAALARERGAIRTPPSEGSPR
jgi:hypothetical protein